MYTVTFYASKWSTRAIQKLGSPITIERMNRDQVGVFLKGIPEAHARDGYGQQHCVSYPEQRHDILIVIRPEVTTDA